MKRVTIQGDALVLEFERKSAEEARHDYDVLRVQIFRGSEILYSDSIGRGEFPHPSEFAIEVTRNEFTRIKAAVAIEWLSWPDTTAKELPPSKTILELYEDLAKLVNAQKGAAA